MHMAERGRPRKNSEPKTARADSYRHPEAESPARPEAGTQAQFKKKKAPARYRYDSSLSPVMEWDGQNSARELGEWLLSLIEESSKLPPAVSSSASTSILSCACGTCRTTTKRT
jgi:adenine-specific DNA-methyltransferase